MQQLGKQPFIGVRESPKITLKLQMQILIITASDPQGNNFLCGL